MTTHIFCYDKRTLVMTTFLSKLCLSQQKFCCDEHLLWQAYFCCNKRCVLRWQTHVCHDKSMLVVTKLLLQQNYICHDKYLAQFGSVLLQQKYFVTTNIFFATKLLLVVTKNCLLMLELFHIRACLVIAGIIPCQSLSRDVGIIPCQSLSRDAGIVPCQSLSGDAGSGVCEAVWVRRSKYPLLLPIIIIPCQSLSGDCWARVLQSIWKAVTLARRVLFSLSPSSSDSLCRLFQGGTSSSKSDKVDSKEEPSLSVRCFQALLWAHVLVRLWMHIWLILILLLLSFLHLGYKRLGRCACHSFPSLML